jgi:hypothetical protein
MLITMDNKKPETQITESDGEFFNSVVALIEQARTHVGRTADLTMCITYFEIGRMIIEEEQGGKARAAYGSGLLKELSAYLNRRVGKGFSETTLRNARKFYSIYAPSIQQTMFAELGDEKKQPDTTSMISKQPILFAESYPFTLGWSHYLILMRIANPDERRFYEIEAERQQWSFRRLQHEYGSSLYERLALSHDKAEVMKLSKYGQMVEQPRDILKNPLVLDFLDTVGILLCHEKDDEIVELTLPDGENIYATEYSLYLPEKALLQRKLAEWTQEYEDAKEAATI